MPRRLSIVWVLLAFAACSAAAESQNMYKWTDDQGEVHYDQFPPAGRKTEKMRAPPPAPAQTPEAGGNNLEKRPDNAEKQNENQSQQELEAKQKAEREEIRKKNCEIAHKNLVNLQRGGNVRYMDASGKVIRLSEEERQKRIEEANKHMKENCNP